MKLRMTILVDVDDAYGAFDEEEREWMESDVLSSKGELVLHSNEVGDEVGYISEVSNIEWIE